MMQKRRYNDIFIALCGFVGVGALLLMYALEYPSPIIQGIGFGAFVIASILLLQRKWHLASTSTGTARLTASFGLFSTLISTVSILQFGPHTLPGNSRTLLIIVLILLGLLLVEWVYIRLCMWKSDT